MTTILAIETSRSLCSVAVQRNAELFEDTRKVERLHNEVVLEMIDDMCTAAGIARRTIDVVAFAAGPGSFTGVRIAAAVAQGIAFGASACIVPVSSSRAMAFSAIDNLSTTPSRILTMTRSRADAYYLAGYVREGDALTLAVDDALRVQWPAELSQAEWIAVGDQPPWWQSVPRSARWGGEVAVTAATIATLGLADFAAGEAVPPSAGLPRYVSGDSPWKKSAQKPTAPRNS